MRVLSGGPIRWVSAALLAAMACGACSSSRAVPARPIRTLRFQSVDYKFVGLDTSLVVAGDTVEFEMANIGALRHQLELKDPDGHVVGLVGLAQPGQITRATMTLKKAGRYVYYCDFEDHLVRGMKGSFTIPG